MLTWSCVAAELVATGVPTVWASVRPSCKERHTVHLCAKRVCFRTVNPGVPSDCGSYQKCRRCEQSAPAPFVLLLQYMHSLLALNPATSISEIPGLVLYYHGDAEKIAAVLKQASTRRLHGGVGERLPKSFPCMGKVYTSTFGNSCTTASRSTVASIFQQTAAPLTIIGGMVISWSLYHLSEASPGSAHSQTSVLIFTGAGCAPTIRTAASFSAGSRQNPQSVTSSRRLEKESDTPSGSGLSLYMP